MSRPVLRLALEIDGEGGHPAAWRRALHPPGALLTGRRLVSVARAAEAAGFPLVTLDDTLVPPGEGTDVVGRLGAVERAAYIAASTSLVGVVATVSTTYGEPSSLASQLASVDHLSLGRAGWLVGTESGADAARTWGLVRVGGEANLRQEARDVVQVVRDLWDSWEDGAVVRDAATGRYLDRERVHYVDFEGTTFSVKGPSITPRPPQGQLVVMAPARLADVVRPDIVLVDGPTPADAATAARVARAPLAFAELDVALDTDDATAVERRADLEFHAPWPEHGRLRHTGSADGLVRLLSELAPEVAGVRIHPLVLDEDLPVLAGRVVPALVRAGIAHRPLPGASLRGLLGLPRPASRFAALRSEPS
ncbi:LLM class flavin-dependent oxidoreductase [Streptomyces sp. NPDC059272]|uniref:LLM class flavin-dependent oxidoreductase n=1 Tax=Streptomyces sp. NPDC059272 TaxID=3346800 RepID=UPI0036C05D42